MQLVDGDGDGDGDGDENSNENENEYVYSRWSLTCRISLASIFVDYRRK